MLSRVFSYEKWQFNPSGHDSVIDRVLDYCETMVRVPTWMDFKRQLHFFSVNFHYLRRKRVVDTEQCMAQFKKLEKKFPVWKQRKKRDDNEFCVIIQNELKIKKIHGRNGYWKWIIPFPKRGKKIRTKRRKLRRNRKNKQKKKKK